MDLANPLRSFIPTVEADVLHVLVHAHVGLTGAEVQRLAGRSYAQVSAVLQRLVMHGLVSSTRFGNAVAYELNRDHVLTPSLIEGTAALQRVEDQVGTLIDAWQVQPSSVVLFGSAARRDGGAQSDIDILLVRPDKIDEDDGAWGHQRHELANRLELWTGSSCQLVELSSQELADAVRRGDPLINRLASDGRTLSGAPVKILITAGRTTGG